MSGTPVDRLRQGGCARRCLPLALLVCVGGSLGGCTVGARYVDLTYPPAGGEEKVAIDAASAVPTRTPEVVLRVADAREYTERIGAVRNGYGIVTASILTEDNITIWLHDAIAGELEKLGYGVMTDVDAETAVRDRLDVELGKLYCDIYMFYDGEVTLHATLQPAHGEAVSGEFPAKVSTGLSWAASGKGTGESLARAMQKSARTMLATFGFVRRE